MTVHDDPIPLKQEVSSSKTIEIPSLKRYIFLFIVSSNIWWYVGMAIRSGTISEVLYYNENL
jgi:hypothetical protein